IVLALLIFIVWWRTFTQLAIGYSLCIVSQVALFCLIFRWQPFNSRLQLPVFVASAPLVAYALGTIPMRSVIRRSLLVLIAALLSYRALPSILKNPARPLAGRVKILDLTREQRYFIEQPQIQASYTGAADFIAATRCRTVGLKTGWSEWEYAFWAVASPRWKIFRLTHVAVTNPSKRLDKHTGAGGKQVCAVVTLNEDRPINATETAPGFVIAWQLQNVSVQLPAASLR
ncbi:MAG TPA: hypothetical protein VHM24_06035, partial [Gemmatimonadaceae bacterium]|nr:hypothetical protein [Gemmatimonadaceae bacterium]